MTSALNILYRTNETFDYLDSRYEDRLHKICAWIFIVAGLLTGSYFYGRDLLELRSGDSDDSINNTWQLTSVIFACISNILNGLISGYLTALILYGLSRLLKGQGEVIHFIIISAYSKIPVLLISPWIIYRDFFLNHEIGQPSYLIINVLNALLWLWMVKIMIQGLMRYNRYKFRKALVNASPFIVFGLSIYIVYYYQLT